MILRIYGGNGVWKADGEYEPGADPELEPCPFCGSNTVDVFNNCQMPSYKAHCGGCGAKGPGGTVPGMPKEFKTVDACEEGHRAAFTVAINLWNVRTSPELAALCDEAERVG